jgi:radical SAM superfamily enzyme YgiQ (UPF0313 family)
MADASDKMKINNVLLIKPVYRKSHYDNRWLPTGLAYISEALDKANIQNRIFDMGLGYKFSDLRKEIEKFNPGLIGVSMMSFGSRFTYQLMEAIKDNYPDMSIAVGGPHLSNLREKVLNECRAVDFGITLEGEEAIVELCRDEKPLREIRGLLFRDNAGGITYTGDRDFIYDLDRIGFPKYAKAELDKYPRFVNIVTSRGCPYDCIYCPVQATIGRKFRIRNAASIAEEIQFWFDKGYREIGIADDNFSLIKERAFALCDEIEKRKMKGLKISCGNGLRADRVDRKLLSRMKEVGFWYIAFGVEAGNNRILVNLRKGEKIETIEQAIKDACELDYRVTLFFLLGSPGESKADIDDSLRLVKKYPVYDARFYNLIPFPNTALYDWASKNNYFRKDPDKFISEASHWVNDPVFETPEMSLLQRKKLHQWANNQAMRYTFEEKKRYNFNSTAEFFKNKGLPEIFSKICARLFWTKWIRRITMFDALKNYF